MSTVVETREDSTKQQKKKGNKKQEEEEVQDDGVYEVEKIIGHRIYKSKVVKYEVKWKGYGEEDNTMEAANTLHDDVPELCIAYWTTQKNTPTPSNVPQPEEAENPKKRVISDEETSAAKKSKKTNNSKGFDHVPKYMVKLGYAFPTEYPTKSTDWDQEVKKICVQASPKDSKYILTYIEWNNEEKTIHEMDEVHTKIPEKLIAYYEERLQFI